MQNLWKLFIYLLLLGSLINLYPQKMHKGLDFSVGFLLEAQKSNLSLRSDTMLSNNTPDLSLLTKELVIGISQETLMSVPGGALAAGIANGDDFWDIMGIVR